MPIRYFATLIVMVILAAVAMVFLGSFVAERMQIPSALGYGLVPALLILALLIRKK